MDNPGNPFRTPRSALVHAPGGQLVPGRPDPATTDRPGAPCDTWRDLRIHGCEAERERGPERVGGPEVDRVAPEALPTSPTVRFIPTVPVHAGS
ncbi:hypothetical protein SLNWT_2708 [Streptomyces albus]|uniref:Uncharacterized protein n=1 Tax=Streptomyces albus (strain ATCC 21838 / DSM 41398 / FERM P-419 / JCM 4703 / NBRC 107858) TaxID=1081613 RepID=A0A0B5EN92_STRA4|nr:hypothetical protein SLNWT_2708 [Streptomyces albus]